MRLRDEVIGAMNLIMHTPRRLGDSGLRVGQAFKLLRGQARIQQPTGGCPGLPE